MLEIQLSDASRVIVQRALAPFASAFALLRERDGDHPCQAAATSSDGAGNRHYDCLVAHGVSERDAVDLLPGPAGKRSATDPIHVQRAGYHLVCLREAQVAGGLQGGDAVAEMLERQLDLAIRLIEVETQRHQCNRDLALITHALDALPLSVFVLDENRRYVFQNLKDREIFMDLRGMTIDEADLDTEMCLRWAHQHDAVLRGEKFDHKDTNRSNGVSFTSRTMMDPVQSEGGICGIVGVSLDCSAETNAILLRQENEERLQSWLKLSSDWVWEADPQFRYTRVEGDAR
ncbi:MAG: hypothetical protein LAT68_17255, partial [Cyclobacteriaceae bacterium]|nr:hypothetical protein [Cyclobacteriaceae bacterium]